MSWDSWFARANNILGKYDIFQDDPNWEYLSCRWGDAYIRGEDPWLTVEKILDEFAAEIYFEGMSNEEIG